MSRPKKETRELIESIMFKDSQGAEIAFNEVMRRKMLSKFRDLTEQVISEDQYALYERDKGDIEVGRVKGNPGQEIKDLWNKGKSWIQDRMGIDPYNRQKLEYPKTAPKIGRT